MPFVPDTGGDAFGAGDPPHGVCFAPNDDTLEEEPTWTRLDDPAGYRMATGWTITRGRANELDKTVTGVATVEFVDTEGVLDPKNNLGPFVSNLESRKQAAIALRNPVTDDWHTLFRGFVGSMENELEMFSTTHGIDRPVWGLVDAFDIFSRVVLTPGSHGYTVATSITDFADVYYQGKPSNLPGEPDVFVHVDQRIVKLLDDAGWPGTGSTGRPGDVAAPLRNIFSGNVQVQGVVYARQDSMMAALYDAADAEFPGIANIYVSKDGVVTFHGRYARFYPSRPGYGINHWYVGTLAAAAGDPDIVPLTGPLRYFSSANDIYNSSVALPYGVESSDPGVVVASDTASINKFGFSSLNFENLLTYAGHDDDGNTVDAVEECNKFAEYYVGNYKLQRQRIGTLRFRSRGADVVGAAALWDMMCRVELGDVITLNTTHLGEDSGFATTWYVEQIRYTASPAQADMHEILLELEVSPSAFYSSNPFGTLDMGES